MAPPMELPIMWKRSTPSSQYLVTNYLILKTVADVQGFTAVAMAWQIEGIDVELTPELFGQTGPVILVGAEAVDQNQSVAIDRFFTAKKACPDRQR